MAKTRSAGQTVELAIEALLRDHPEGRACALSANGLIVPMPGRVPLNGQEMIEGRALIDEVVAADRKRVIDLWVRVRHEGAGQERVRLRNAPDRWVILHFADLRAAHGVLLGVVIPSDEAAAELEASNDSAPVAPRLCSLQEDEGGNVLDCDEAFTRMCGFAPEEVIGNSVLDHLHPEDQGRAVEGWLQMLSTRRDQHFRGRRKHKDGHWIWVDTTLHNFLGQPDRNHVLVELVDVSAEMAAHEALQEREELLSRLTDAMPVGLLQIDANRHVVYRNAHLDEILHGGLEHEGGKRSSRRPTARSTASRGETGVASGPAASHAPASLEALMATLTKKGTADFYEALAEVLAAGTDRDVEVDVELSSGAWRRVLFTMRALRRSGGEGGGAIMCALDVTDSARARMELEERATYDALTHVHNRLSILGAIETELQSGAATGVIYIDLDKFKPVNDVLGHAAGDELLCHVTERLRAASRRVDDVGRLGGDEFVVLLRRVRGTETAMRTARRIARSLAGRFETSYGAVDLRASIGVACVDGERVAAEELVERADTAMYESKQCAQGTPVLAVKPKRTRGGAGERSGGRTGAGRTGRGPARARAGASRG